MSAIRRHLNRPLRAAALSVAALSITIGLTGCANDAQTGAVVGGLLGAAAGAVVGHQSGERDAGAAIGAGVGALGGYVIGNESDKQKQQYNNPNYNY